MIRCVVTGERPDGKSVVVSDTEMKGVPVPVLGPETEFFTLWGGDQVPALPTDGIEPSHPKYFPPPGGFRFVASVVDPDSAQPATTEDPEVVLAQYEAAMPGFRDQSADDENVALHRTETVDFAIVVSGELWLELDDGVEVHLQPGDCVIQNGARHAWHNRSDKPCLVVGAMIGANRSS